VAVKIDDLSKEIAKQLSQYTADVEEAVEAIKEDVSKEAVALLKQTSPKKTGDYRKGWAKKKVGKDIVIHNKTDGQLTHLLENGHVKVGGGRVPAKVHIRPVEEKTTESYLDQVEKAIKP
jgi:galactokinase/mevalonate kinase-like predicted kinase